MDARLETKARNWKNCAALRKVNFSASAKSHIAGLCAAITLCTIKKGIIMASVAIDMNALPELSSAIAVPMGAYGSISRPDHMNGSMFDLIVAVIMIILDDGSPNP
jgi:hypothetical protein